MMGTFSSGVKCFRSFLIRSLRYLNGRTLSPFPTEAGQLSHPTTLHALVAHALFELFAEGRELLLDFCDLHLEFRHFAF